MTIPSDQSIFPPMTSSTRLIVNADDLGAGAATDRGILRAFREGIVTSVSLLANGPNFDEAACIVLGEGLPVGIHLNLSEWSPLAGPIPGLTTAGGEFRGKAETRRLLSFGRVDILDLRHEIAAQIWKVLDAGIEPDHLDTHQHCFLFPPLATVILEAAWAFGIGAVRLPLPAEPEEDDAGAPLAADLSLYRRLAPAAAAAVHRTALVAPDGVWGMPLLDRLDEPSLAGLLGRLPAGNWELMAHPGYRDPGHPFATEARERELAALTSPAIKSLVADLGIDLITFRDLSCGY